MEHLDLAASTLTGDLRDLLVGILRDRHGYKAFRDLSEDEQRRVLVDIESTVRDAVRSTVQIVAAADFQAFPFTVENVQIKKDLKLTLTAGKETGILAAAAHWYGKGILVVPVNLESYVGQRKPAQVIPDQAELPIADDGGDSGPAEPDMAAIADVLEAGEDEAVDYEEPNEEEAAAPAPEIAASGIRKARGRLRDGLN